MPRQCVCVCMCMCISTTFAAWTELCLDSNIVTTASKKACIMSTVEFLVKSQRTCQIQEVVTVRVRKVRSFNVL